MIEVSVLKTDILFKELWIDSVTKERRKVLRNSF